MKCENINSLMLDYLDNNLNPANKKDIENHLEQCSICRNKLSQYKSLNKLLQNTKKVESSQLFKNELLNEIDKEKRKVGKMSIRLHNHKNSFQVAAAILVFVCGTFFGLIVQNSDLNKSRISLLENEVNQLQQQVIFEILNEDQTASEKIMAINYTNKKQDIEIDFANLLINILNTDGNMNVRMAALDALSNFKQDPFVYANLLNSLNELDDPRLQIGLIKAIASKNDNESQKSIIEFLNKGDINPDVRLYAKELALIN